ncbi:type ISP restriction/modification enzyme [Mucilaginibacter segetis]|uniref:site-specific DNA-methyltransferase (adenine-specific) n=1 Tax=Mucilaginibacter segetis TaxID=2793071 RepID=A0A934PVX2_9SPHI|nr:type ISP restriction/modification enzyme [Mucilaginibacter segetis]MBK0380385.1 N-6 DNA methylase [Mucilaginibacter segetis]
MTISQYIDHLQAHYRTGIATEHTYRGYLQSLLESIAQGVAVTNEPARIKCGAPDYIITRNQIPVGYIEAKDIGKDIQHKDYKEQFNRYRKSLDNLIITDYLEFELYIDGELKTKISIAKIEGNHITPLPQNFEAFTALIRSFCTYVGQTIKSSQKLAVMMADKAKLLSQVIENALSSDVETEANSSLKEQMHAFKDILIHDIKPREFADIYAQTIAYGMFAARLHDPTLATFSRQEAAELIPKTNPFLRKLFQYIAGYDLDTRIVWIVDALADIFRATDVAALLHNFGKATQTNDPIIHFYETFLAEYDPALRKARGVWYTPEPVVNFIVRAVDDILKTEFNLPMGLADSSKIKVKRKAFTQATTDRRSVVKEVETEVEVHKVQILDPATGTGTFLAEAIKHIYKRFAGQQGIWSNYVENHLIPRLNGFELLMASYAMAHLKLDMLLTETGYKATRDQRFRVYLTNSLEEHHADTGTLFANWLSSEANEANHIKRDTPVMVVMGNPPYSVSSNNKSEWIEKLTADYKKDLNERNIQPLSDDYIKFIRFGQHFINKNGEGILAYISNNSFLDGIIHRQMRKHLLESFDKIYIINLHGDSKKKEIAIDGSSDQNVFDIMQGVSINIFIKKTKKEVNAKTEIFSIDFTGKRNVKYILLEKSLKELPFEKLNPHSPHYYFTKKNFYNFKDYSNFISVKTIFKEDNSGVQTEFDALAINEDTEILKDRVLNLTKNTAEVAAYNMGFSSEYLKKIINAKNDILNNKFQIIDYNYRAFDKQKAIYTGYSNGIMGRPRGKTMVNFFHQNIGLILPKQVYPDFKHVFITDCACDANFIASAKKFGCGNVFPLYLYYNDNSKQISLEQSLARTPNLNKETVHQIATGLGLTFTNEKETTEGTFAPIDILDYIYAVLHSPAYREKYKEFLKIDFPRVPYPKDAAKFCQLVKLGGELRQLHLLESHEVDNYITTYPQDGDNIVVKPEYKAGRVYINPTQYFEGVPEGTWQFYIGGYQPAQKWLKDRKGRELSFDDILHYQRMIVALTQTQHLMLEIDKVGVE